MITKERKFVMNREHRAGVKLFHPGMYKYTPRKTVTCPFCKTVYKNDIFCRYHKIVQATGKRKCPTCKGIIILS
jgi:hypothetical protein